ncbi:MAG: hypothetical protein DMG27_18990, partial [Acidobacteria bacterium]
MVPGLKMARVLTLRSIAHPLLLVSLAVGAGCLHGRPLPPRDSPAPSEARVAQVFGRLPLYFIENHGQADARVAYYVQGRETSLYFTPEGVTFALTKKRPEGKTRPVAFRPEGGSAAEDGGGPERWAVKLEFIGAKPGVAPEGRDQTAAVVSYFKGPRAQWKTGLPTFASLRYRDLWPGIDLSYAGSGGRLKSSFVVRPGAAPGQVRLAYRGATAVGLSAAGELEVTTPVGGFREERPYAYQEVDGRRVEVASSYALETAAEGGQA